TKQGTRAGTEARRTAGFAGLYTRHHPLDARRPIDNRRRRTGGGLESHRRGDSRKKVSGVAWNHVERMEQRILAAGTDDRARKGGTSQRERLQDAKRQAAFFGNQCVSAPVARLGARRLRVQFSRLDRSAAA